MQSSQDTASVAQRGKQGPGIEYSGIWDHAPNCINVVLQQSMEWSRGSHTEHFRRKALLTRLWIETAFGVHM